MSQNGRRGARPKPDEIRWSAATSDSAQERNWRRSLPVLGSDRMILRGLTAADAPSLLANVSDREVLQYLAAAPSTVDGFERFIRWTQRERRRGTHVCYGVVPRETGRVIGVIQIWPVERDYSVAEWGFVLGRAYWGTGLFVDAASLFLTFTFDWLGVKRLEARAAAMNGRGIGALRKLGAVREGVLRSAFQAEHARLDHVMWSILSEDWAPNKRGSAPDSGSVARGGPCAPLRSLAGALRAPRSHRAAAEGASDEQPCGL
jgi:ribosomal-protein-alanine N-acetyltransferase